jgi:NAD(P)-dependent dehydrogenase (short-subunit alcohol dehydrogenase family)
MRLKNRVALVSGMAMGIGQGIAELFAQEGADIIGIDIDEKSGRQVAEKINSNGRLCQFFAGDVSSEESIRACIKAGLQKFGKIDVLVNVVGIAAESPLDKLDLTEWDRILRVNLTSMFLTSKYVLPAMLEQKHGSIIHVSSVQALLGFPGYPHYAASKGAVISLTRQMASEYACRGVRVNCIAPGTIETPMNIKVLERAADPKALRKAWERMQPTGRLGQPKDIAYGAVYFASDESSFVTGQCLVIDGGVSSCGPLRY